MPNFGNIIKGLNKKAIKDFEAKQMKAADERKRNEKKPRGRANYLTRKDCTCDSTHHCPLNNKCNRTGIIYKATLETLNMEHNGKFYVGSAANFKDRWSNHNYTFNNRIIAIWSYL